jgi:DNA replication protein DnaC
MTKILNLLSASDAGDERPEWGHASQLPISSVLSAPMSRPPSTTSDPELPGDPDCPTCRGEGWQSRGPVPAGVSPFEPCHCLQAIQAERARQARMLRQSTYIQQLAGDLGRLAGRRLDSFDLDRRLDKEPLEWNGATYDQAIQRKALRRTLAHARAYAEAPGGWMYLFGPPGGGKSLLLAMICTELVERGHQAVFVTVPDMLDWLRSGIEQKDMSERLAALRDAEVLALDDLGAEQGDWAQSRLYTLLNHRYSQDLPLLISSNVPPEAIDPASGRLASRIRGMGPVVALTVSDYRRLPRGVR